MSHEQFFRRRAAGKMKTLVATVLLSFFCGLAGSTRAQTLDLNLPQMGEPADQVMSQREEQALGQRFMLQIREHLPLVDDIELNQYVQALGRRLLLGHPSINPADFHFFIIENPDINAFAIPGGFIGINSGLISAAENEAQLASVMAHEIAHVTQRHIARLQASQGNTGLRTLATIVAALLISSQSAEAGQAALLTGIAASQQSRINFTRRHEYEADRIGIQLLTSAGYNGRAAIDFFEILRRRISLNSAESLEFLQTHPLTTNRIAEARNNANRLQDPLAVEDSVEFQLQQMKVAVLHANNPATLARSLQAGHVGTSAVARLYGRILLHLETGTSDEANPLVQELQTLLPDNSTVQLLAAKVANAAGRPAEAERLLLQITELQPDNYAAVDYYLDMLSQQRRNSRARSTVKSYLRHSTDPAPNIYRRYAELLETSGDVSASHEAMAEHFFLLGDNASALEQLRLALRNATANSNDESRLTARLQDTRARLTQTQNN
jgi:predicted Zn-dependent protease